MRVVSHAWRAVELVGLKLGARLWRACRELADLREGCFGLQQQSHIVSSGDLGVEQGDIARRIEVLDGQGCKVVKYGAVIQA